jgi:hypothetical protein
MQATLRVCAEITGKGGDSASTIHTFWKHGETSNKATCSGGSLGFRQRCCRFDYADGAGDGGAEVFGGGEGLTDPGGLAAPFGHGERGADAAQGDVHGDVVAIYDEQPAQGGVIAGLVAQVVVDELDVGIELADLLGFGPAELELEDHVSVRFAVVEEEVDEELALSALDRYLDANECESGAQTRDCAAPPRMTWHTTGSCERFSMLKLDPFSGY